MRRKTRARPAKKQTYTQTTTYKLGADKIDENDLDGIRNGKKANDKIISLYLAILNAKCQSEGKQSICGSSFILPAVQKSMLKGDTSFLSHVKMLHQSDMFLIPTFVYPNHWILTVIDKTQKKIIIHDPLGNTNKYPEIEKQIMYILENCLNNHTSYVISYAQSSTRQTNGEDCGIFVMKFAKCILNNESTQFRRKSTELRNELASDIVKGSKKYEEKKSPDDFSSTLYSLLRMTLSSSSDPSSLDYHIAMAGLRYREPRTPADGNCLFHAIVDQLRMHGIKRITYQQLRKQIVEYMRRHPFTPDGTHLESFVHGRSWDEHLDYMSDDGTWGII
jgi:hypothetical protein